MIEVKIKTLSFTLVGSGGGSGLIDSDIVFDELGIPYIPGRRIKGILRESAKEVSEMLGFGEKYVEVLFGKPGGEMGKLNVGNFYIPKYEKIVNEFLYLKHQNSAFNYLLNKSLVIDYFTQIINQTKIENGVAKDNSLRTLRVIKPGFEFIGELRFSEELNKQELAFLTLAILNMRRIGTARNRGFGKIECCVDMSVKEALEILMSNSTTDYSNATNSTSSNFPNITKSGNKKKMRYFVRLLSPTLISKQAGDQNVVNTEDYIPASTIRGCLANIFIGKMDLRDSAHNDTLFCSFFLEGELKITPAFITDINKKENEYFPMPLALKKEKRVAVQDGVTFYNVLVEKPRENTKHIPGFIYISDRNIFFRRPFKSLQFHNKRDRLLGKSTEDTGAVFYYEALKRDQVFGGWLIGDDAYLRFLKDELGDKFKIYLGRSKTAQYGEVELSFGEIDNCNDTEVIENEFVLLTISPIIVYNDKGYPEPTISNLLKYLKRIFGSDVEVVNVEATTDRYETYVGIWNMRTMSYDAFAPGSSFLLHIPESKEYDRFIYIGEKNEWGYGLVQIIPSLEESNYNCFVVRDEIPEQEIKASKEIIQELLKKRLKEFFKNRGLANAANFSKEDQISNHLISRLIDLLMVSESFKDWSAEVKSMQNKEAGKTLEKIRLWEEINPHPKDFFNSKKADIPKPLGLLLDHKMVTVNFEDDKLLFELFKEYWVSFFSNLRLLKKRKEAVQKERGGFTDR